MNKDVSCSNDNMESYCGYENKFIVFLEDAVNTNTYKDIATGFAYDLHIYIESLNKIALDIIDKSCQCDNILILKKQLLLNIDRLIVIFKKCVELSDRQDLKRIMGAYIKSWEGREK